MAFNKNMVGLAKANTFFQKEVYLDKNVQIVLMSLFAVIISAKHRVCEVDSYVDEARSRR